MFATETNLPVESGESQRKAGEDWLVLDQLLNHIKTAGTENGEHDQDDQVHIQR